MQPQEEKDRLVALSQLIERGGPRWDSSIESAFIPFRSIEIVKFSIPGLLWTGRLPSHFYALRTSMIVLLLGGDASPRDRWSIDTAVGHEGNSLVGEWGYWTLGVWRKQHRTDWEGASLSNPGASGKQGPLFPLGESRVPTLLIISGSCRAAIREFGLNFANESELATSLKRSFGHLVRSYREIKR
jgi:hypothetical protein